MSAAFAVSLFFFFSSSFFLPWTLPATNCWRRLWFAIFLNHTILWILIVLRLLETHSISFNWTFNGGDHVCGFVTISIFICFTTLIYGQFIDFGLLKCKITIQAMLLMNNDKNCNDPFNFAYRVRVVQWSAYPNTKRLDKEKKIK